MMWWPSKSEKLLREVIASQRDEILSLRKENGLSRERIDRLTEALARKAGVDLMLPLPVPVSIEPPQPNPLMVALRDPAQITVSEKWFKEGVSK